MSNDRGHREGERVPLAQRLYDRPFFWLIAGFVTMLAFYTLWGLLEIARLPQSSLP